MSRLATTALGGLAALTALLLIRSVRRSASEPPDTLMIVHAEPCYDTPALHRAPRRPRMFIVPL